MRNLVEEARQQIENLIADACKSAVEAGELPEGSVLSGAVEIPRDPANGDFAANHCMVGAKKLHKAPKAIADILLSHLNLDSSFFSSVETAGPGFLNFRLGDSWYEQVLKTVDKEGERYGCSNMGKGKSVLVEFVSANPTGPMHMGNARGGVLGDALAEVLSRCGYDVKREFYLNDTGNQVEKFAQSIDARYRQLILGEENVPFPEDGYHGDDIRDLAKAFYEKYRDTYLTVPENERHVVMAEFGLNTNIPKMKENLEQYGIHYDCWFPESSLHESGYVEDTIQALTDMGATYEKDGALWLKTSALVPGCEKDDVLKRANGFYTYFAADIAYHRNKLLKRGFDRVINVWGADHHGHIARLKGALDALGLDGTNRLDIVLMQLVKLMSNGQEVRMSKRTGKMISLADLLEEIPLDAARFFFNSRPESPVLFDMELARRQDSENPVYYVQYAHARICSMLENLRENGFEIPSAEEVDCSLLCTEPERDLISQIAKLPEEISLCAKNLDPSSMGSYALELATRFHKFYTVCRIKGEAEPLAKARLYLASQTKTALENALSVIGVSAPEKM